MAIDHCSNDDKKSLIMQEHRPWLSKEMTMPVVVVVLSFLGNYHRRHQHKESYIQFLTYLR